MLDRRNRMPALLGAAFVGFCTPLVGSAATAPTPPTNLCVGADCAAKLAAPAPAPASTATGSAGYKWHPGHYVWLDPHTSQAAQFAAIDALSAETSVKGFELFLNWATLEGPTPGDYSNGFATVDAYLAKFASLKVPKRLMIGVNERTFGTPVPAGTTCAVAAQKLLPAYISSLSDGGCALAAPGAAGSLSVFARFWEPEVMDRLIALSQAYAQRYDQNPLIEMFWGNGETSVAAPPGTGFTEAAYNTQLERWYDASAKVWTHTQLRLAANWAGSNAQTLSLMSYTTANGGVAVGGPDPELPLPDITRPVQANEIFRAALGGGPDFRGVVPWVGEVQGLGIGVKFTQTPAQIYDYESNTMHASYMIWYMNTYLGGPAQMWSTGILPFIQSIHGAIYGTACPSGYQRGCNAN
jgi:hypothetical protein